MIFGTKVGILLYKKTAQAKMADSIRQEDDPCDLATFPLVVQECPVDHFNPVRALPRRQKHQKNIRGF